MCNLKDEDLEIENRNPIKIQIETNGGCATTCLNLIEVIKNSKTPIHTIVMGKAYSAGAFLLSCGHKRFAFKNSAILIHQVSFYGYQSVNATNAAKHAEFQNGLCDRLFDSLLGNTKITEEEFSNNRDKEWYLFGDEAKELGIVDYIIGEDVDLQAVIL
jgi:ATP-dependent Clp protease protease subunit